MALLTLPGATINFELWQAPATSGDWVTLINGHTRPLNDFRMMGKKLVEAGYRVLAFDNRGAGLTEVTRPFSLEDLCSDVSALWQELSIKSTYLLGISMGGFISQKLALDFPEIVEKLVLVSTAARHGGISPDERPWSSDATEVTKKLSSYFTPQFAEKNAVLVRSMAKQIATQVQAGKFSDNSRLQRQALEGFDVNDRLFAIAAPTLVIHGTEDAIIPVKEGKKLAAGIPTAEFEAVSGTGHLLLAEAPAVLYQLVLSFFRSA